MDGWGLSPLIDGNATIIAKTPVLDYLYSSYKRASISASGLEVGLNRGEMGNSEVGHLNIGTGRVVWESLPRIDYTIESGSFFTNQVLFNNFKSASNGRLHLIGLVSSGGVHSHIRHLFALLKAAKENHLQQVFVHFISDGRDTPANVAETFVKSLEEEMKKQGIGKIATIIGRYFAMDRDKHADRTTKAYDLFTKGTGQQYSSAEEAIKSNYQNGKSDEFIEPCLIDPEGVIGPDDAVILFNYRADRMRQLTEAFITQNLQNFTLDATPSSRIISMTQYEKSYTIPVLFEPVDLRNCLADVLEFYGKTQHHIAETEKYAHVTYFFNGGREDLHQKEVQTMVKSPKVPTYDLKPEMSAYEVADKTIEAIDNDGDFIVVNFANGDMVGHTGILDAAVLACETVDKCLAKVLAKASQKGYNCIVTADHGNCEIMIDPATKQPSKEHTTSPVPFVFMDFTAQPFMQNASYSFTLEDMMAYSAEPYRGVLSDISPTVLGLMGIEKPSEMEGINLVERI